jgi:hypothetical protein
VAAQVITLTAETDGGAFVARLADGGWDLVVAAHQDGSSSAELVFDEPLAEWICARGRAIPSDFRAASATASATLACAGARFDGVTKYSTVTSNSALSSGTEALFNPGWGIHSSGRETAYEVYATNGVTTDSVHDEATSMIGGGVTATGTTTFRESWAVEPARALYAPTWAVELAWEGAATTTWALPEVDATPWQVLSMRLLAVHEAPLNPPGGGLDLTVVLADAAGTSASLPLSTAPGARWGRRRTDWWEPSRSPYSRRALSRSPRVPRPRPPSTSPGWSPSHASSTVRHPRGS